MAAFAEPNPGFPVVTSNPRGGYTIAGHHLGFVNAALYRIACGSAYHQAFHVSLLAHSVRAGDALGL